MIWRFYLYLSLFSKIDYKLIKIKKTLLVMEFIKRMLPDSIIEKGYVKAGANFGNTAGYLCLGEYVDFEMFLNKLIDWEERYSGRGFRTVSMDRFIGLGSYGKSIDDVIGQRLEQGEEPVFHAQTYREYFLGEVEPVIDLGTMVQDRQPQVGEYNIPSTEKRK